MTPVIVYFHNDPHTSAWEGYLEQGVIRFDFTNQRGPRRFFVVPDKHIMFADESSLTQVIPNAHWYVHIVDAFEYDPERRIWCVEDREIDVIVEPGLQSYRVIDLEEFGEAVEDGSLSLSDARRILTGLQQFLDEFLHSKSFPPKVVQQWTIIPLQPRPVDVKSLPFL